MCGLLTRVLVLVTLALGIAVVPVAPARAEKQDARKHYDRATAAFGLGRYAEAAAEYEAAFGLRPDSALLYNCAQSYRLAGNKARALELYRNYLRLFGEASNAEDARKHVNDLELEVAAERAVSQRPEGFSSPSSKSTVVSPPIVAPSVGPTSVAGPPATSSTIVPTRGSLVLAPGIVAPTSPPAVHVAAGDHATGGSDDSGQAPLLRRPWFWVAVGAAVVGGTVAVLLGTRGEKDPTATLGTVPGN